MEHKKEANILAKKYMLKVSQKKKTGIYRKVTNITITNDISKEQDEMI